MTATPSPLPPSALDLRALARSGEALAGELPWQALERLASDLPSWPEASEAPPVRWQAQAEWRQPVPLASGLAGAQAQEQLWAHLSLDAALPQTCQRCLQAYQEPVQVDRWFRFVKDEATALAEDDEAEEDLLVLEPRFDLATLIEDELLMALPLVPMHEVCPAPLQPARDELKPVEERTNPFAALAALKAGAGRDGAGS